MKTHISCSYGFDNTNPEYVNQRLIANEAAALGFVEMGIFRYNVSSDTDAQLSVRHDGIIASVERGDVVLLQTPTGNGEDFERRLADKISAYGGRPIFISEKYTNSLLVKKQLLDYVAPYAMADLCKAKTEPLEGEIPICFAITDRSGNYCSYLGIVLKSILDHTTANVAFHVIHDQTLSEDAKTKLQIVANSNHSRIEFHYVESDRFSADNSWLKLYSIASMFRLDIPKMFPDMEKAIYLDADLLFLRDIKELWDIDISDYCMAGVHDVGFERGITPSECITDGRVKVQNYVNSGVLVMNLKKIREKGDLLEMALDFLNKNPRSILPDQDAINVLFHEEIKLLDPKWNAYTRYERLETLKMTDKVYHYMGEPYIAFYEPTEYDEAYIRYRMSLPWGDAIPIQELYRGMRTGYSKADKLQKLIKALEKGNKKKIFYGEYTMGMRSIISMVGYKSTDYFISKAKDAEGLNHGIKVKSSESLKKEKIGSVVIFVMPDADDRTGMQKLCDLGFKQDSDFFVVPSLLTLPQGGYLC